MYIVFTTTSPIIPKYYPVLLFNTNRLIHLSSINASLLSLPNRRLERLETDANLNPSDPVKQAALYKELIRTNQNPQAIISRFEQYPHYATNDDALQSYVLALTNANLLHLIAPKLKKYFTSSQQQQQQQQQQNTSHQPLLESTKQSPIHVHIIPNESSSFSWRKAAWSLTRTTAWAFFLLTGIGLFFDSQGVFRGGSPGANGSGGPLGPGSTKINEINASNQPLVKFEDVAGVDEAKQELAEVVGFLLDPSKFTALGGKMVRGVLLTGPPGTGKTLLARAVAGEANVPFLFMSGSEFDELYVGVGARRVRELFQAARNKQPCIIFIDELDAIGGKRNPKDQSYMRQTLNQLLVELDGFSQSEGVIVMAATNFPELLDPALVRPGRFDKNVHVPLPDVRGRLQILDLHLKQVTVNPLVDVSLIARGTPGFSGAELANLVNQAALQASVEGCKSIELRHFEYAKDKLIMGAERKSAVISESSRKLTAFHEGGHALVAMHTPGAIPLHKATILPRGRSLGMTVQLPELDKDNYTKMEYLAMIDVAMGGRAAEELVFGEDYVTSGAASDLESATRIAYKFVTELGMSKTVGLMSLASMDKVSSQTKMAIEQEVRSVLDGSYKRVLRLLRDRHGELERLAWALVEFETLSRHEMEDVCRGISNPSPIGHLRLPKPVIGGVQQQRPDVPLSPSNSQPGSTTVPSSSA